MKPFQVLFFLPLCWCEFNIDDSVLYKIDFPGLKSPQKDGDSSGGEASKGLFEVPELETITMTSKNNEQYYCTIPKVVDKRMEEENAYTGLHPLGLLEKLFIQQACAYRLESYWTYELCHGKYIRQYHEEREAKNIKVQEYYLGKFDKEKYDDLLAAHGKDVAEGITRHPPTKRLEQMNMPYYEVNMEDGTPCDLNGQPRRSRVLYVCYPQGKNEIYSLKEVSTCEYEIVVLTSLLCSHPSYRPVESNEHSIGCRPVSEASSRKPKMLQEIETESIKLRSEKMFEAHMMGGSKPGQVKIEIKPVQIDNVDDEELAEAAKEAKSNLWKTGSTKEPFKPLMDAQVVKEFLKGDYCLYGGSGWWKYEFCYGKKVDQYHEEGKGQKTVINLGRFSKEKHMDWLEQHPTKRPKQGDARKHVSHFYSGGDICDLTGKERQIEVKLKCKKADSPSTVSLYLLEPKTCEYVLGVESPLVCDILPHADENGMMPEGLLDSIDKEDFGELSFGKSKPPFKMEQIFENAKLTDIPKTLNIKSPLNYDKTKVEDGNPVGEGDFLEEEGFDVLRMARNAALSESIHKREKNKHNVDILSLMKELDDILSLMKELDDVLINKEVDVKLITFDKTGDKLISLKKKLKQLKENSMAIQKYLSSNKKYVKNKNERDGHRNKNNEDFLIPTELYKKIIHMDFLDLNLENQSDDLENDFDDENDLEDDYNDLQDDMEQDFEDDVDYDDDSEEEDSGVEPIASPSEAIFTEEEERTFEELKRRHKSGSDGDQSSKVKTSQITKESVKIIDGVKTTSKQMIINGKLVSSEQTEEYVESKAAVDEEAQDKTETEGEDER